MSFAKLFESASYGQLLVKVDRAPDDKAPEVRIYCNPPGMGVCSMAMGFPDDDRGWDAAEAAFAKFDLAMAESAVSDIFEMLNAKDEQGQTK
jgi:hypothetical protein